MFSKRKNIFNLTATVRRFLTSFKSQLTAHTKTDQGPQRCCKMEPYKSPESSDETQMNANRQGDYAHSAVSRDGFKPQQPDEDQYYATKPYSKIPQRDIALHSGNPLLTGQYQDDEDPSGDVQPEAMSELSIDPMGPSYKSMGSFDQPVFLSSVGDVCQQGGQPVGNSAGGGGSQDSGRSGSGQGRGSNGDGGASGGWGGNSGGGGDGDGDGEGGRKPHHSHNTDEDARDAENSSNDESDDDVATDVPSPQQEGNAEQGTGPGGEANAQSEGDSRCKAGGADQQTPSNPAQCLVSVVDGTPTHAQDDQHGAVGGIPVQCVDDPSHMELPVYTLDLDDLFKRCSPTPLPRSRQPGLQMREPFSLTDGCDEDRGGQPPVAGGRRNRVHSLRREMSEIRLRDGVSLVGVPEAGEQNQGTADGSEEVIDLGGSLQQNQDNPQSLATAPQQADIGESVSNARRQGIGTSVSATQEAMRMRRDGSAAVDARGSHPGRPPGASVQEETVATPSDNTVGEGIQSQLSASGKDHLKIHRQAICAINGLPGVAERETGQLRDILCHLCQKNRRWERLCPCGHSLCFWCARRCLGVYQEGKRPERPCPHCGTRILLRELV